MNLTSINFDILKKYSITKEYKSGDIIFNEGDKCLHLGIIIEGEIKIVTYTYLEKEETINTVSTGDMFGQFLLFSTHDNYFGSAIALKKTKILFINKTNLLKLFDEDKNFLNLYLKAICDQSIILKQQNKLYAHKNIRDRIMFYVTSNTTEGKCKIKSISSLALILNIPRPSLSRELIKMQDEGLIKYDKTYIKYLK